MGGKTLYAAATTVDILGDVPGDVPGDIHDGQHIGKNDSQLLYGEGFTVERTEGDWVYGQCAVDGYRGFARAAHLSAHLSAHGAPTHFIDVALSHLYPEPSFKTRPLLALSFLSRIRVEQEREDGFIRTHTGAWVFESHIQPLSALSHPPHPAPLETALMFLNAPYLYGGRAATGVDCSGLIQLAALRSGIPCPRDSGDQARALGRAVPFAERTKGDFVFFKGHIGILTDAGSILNATARHMTTLIEPLGDLIKAYGDVTAVKRV